MSNLTTENWKEETRKKVSESLYGDWTDFPPEAVDKIVELISTLLTLKEEEMRENERKLWCKRHDWGYGEGYVPNNQKGEPAKGLKCAYCNAEMDKLLSPPKESVKEEKNE